MVWPNNAQATEASGVRFNSRGPGSSSGAGHLTAAWAEYFPVKVRPVRTQEVDAGPSGEDGEGDLRGKNSGHGQDAIEFASHLVTFVVSRVVVVRSTSWACGFRARESWECPPVD